MEFPVTECDAFAHFFGDAGARVGHVKDHGRAGVPLSDLEAFIYGANLGLNYGCHVAHREDAVGSKGCRRELHRIVSGFPRGLLEP